MSAQRGMKTRRGCRVIPPERLRAGRGRYWVVDDAGDGHGASFRLRAGHRAAVEDGGSGDQHSDGFAAVHRNSLVEAAPGAVRGDVFALVRARASFRRIARRRRCASSFRRR